MGVGTIGEGCAAGATERVPEGQSTTHRQCREMGEWCSRVPASEGHSAHHATAIANGGAQTWHAVSPRVKARLYSTHNT